MSECTQAATLSAVPATTASPPRAAFEAEIDHVVVGLDDVEVVLDERSPSARCQLLGDDGRLGRERNAFFDGHVKDIGDGLAGG